MKGFYTMNDIYDQKSTIWNKRLRKCISNNQLNQTAFANALNKKYFQSFTQKDVSRWVNVGSTNRKEQVGFPKFQTMIMIADFFEVDIGYLTGETDSSTFSLEKTSEYLQMSPVAIQNLRQFTVSSYPNSLMFKHKREALNNFFAADNIGIFYQNLEDLYSLSNLSEIRSNVNSDGLDDTIDYLRRLEYESKVYKYELNESLILILDEVYPDLKNM